MAVSLSASSFYQAIYSAKYNGYKWMEMNGLGSFQYGDSTETERRKGCHYTKGDLVKIDMQAKVLSSMRNQC